jgi:predicted helicase/very-short-patch-repair endonuclease
MTLEQYIDNINKRYKLGNATEHTFRGDLQQLLESLVPDIRATNEPKRQSCGAPDYILTKKEIPVGFIEAKDIGDKDLEGVKKTGNKEQFDRYKKDLGNIIFTDYIDFYFYRYDVFITKISVGEITEKGIKPLPENFATFTNLMVGFCNHIDQTIKSSQKLAQMMANKARNLGDTIEKALISDVESHENSTLKDQMNGFRQVLIHDITPKGFADVYAQTIAYGLFAARLHDPTLPTFSREEAATLIPKSNPFLRKLFNYIAGPDLDDRIKWIVDDLIQIFLACNVVEILKNYGKSTKMEDPIIHFYETFLSEYDPKLRKARGVWYTPAPVVNFIIRAVDDILKTEFDLPQGLADTSKTRIKVQAQGQNKTIEQEVHKVQILDPATGTGTFLAETIKHIHKKFEGQQGIWSNYVETHLLPRLNGFELLMASYAMAHLKLDLLLTETGYKKTTPPDGHPSKGGEQRLRVYLTNSLEEASSERPNLFMSQWLTEEAAQADVIKRDTPVMCVIGNPPYAVSSTNKNEWIQNLISIYKKDLNERKINLDDDYIKFIRYGQHYIDKNGSGILAYISNNSFIDGITHRQMRKNLLESFDKIYILDLHGNAKKKEVCPDGSADQNVFDIMQGVSINIFVKTGNKKKTELGQVFQSNLQGKREFKYETLNSNTIQSFEWKKLEFTKPNYFFVPKNFDEIKNYEKGFKIDELINSYVSGVESVRDKISIQFNTESLKNVVTDFINLDAIEIAKKYNTEDARDWKIERAKEDVKSNIDNPKVWQNINYRPFDIRKTFYSGKQNGFVCNGRYNVMKHLLEPNIGLLITNKNRQLSLGYAFTTRFISDRHFLDSAADSMAVFPLYLYPETNGQQTIKTTLAFSHPSEGGEFGRVPNLNTEIVNKFAEKLGIPFVAEKSATLNSPPLEGCPQGGVEKKETISTINNTPIKRNFIENLPYNPKLKQLVKDKRKAGILSEVLFWVQVHKGKFHKIDFDRQRIIGNYIVDFYVKTLGLIVEIDGNSHDYKQDYDAERQLYFENLGLKVFRCTDDDVKKNIDSVLMALEDYIIDEYGESRDLTVDVDEKIPPRPLGTPPKEGNFAPIDILDYIYAVLHSPTYREKYKEFLKIDFPRVPYPKDNDTFWQLVKLGGEIRQIHLLESPTVEKYITQYPEDGNNTVTKSKFISSPPLEGLGVVGKVYINDTQYFDNVPQIAWEFFIGGYQPAQKWLKDRKERTLEFDDILHYQKIIVALSETDRLMNEINKIDIE